MSNNKVQQIVTNKCTDRQTDGRSKDRQTGWFLYTRPFVFRGLIRDIIKWSGISHSFARLWLAEMAFTRVYLRVNWPQMLSSAVFGVLLSTKQQRRTIRFTNEIAFRCKYSAFSGVFGVSMFSHAKLITAGRDKIAVIVSLVISFCERKSW